MTVDGLFPRKPFTSFGPCGLLPLADAPTSCRVEAGHPGRLRKWVREQAPRRQPGVYGMVNACGELIYVGKAKCLRTRLLGYFRPKSRDPKAGRILQHTRVLVWENVSSEFAALLRELELIQRFRPRFNVHGQPLRRRRTYICIGRPPAPYLFLTSRPTGRASACFGPVPAGDAAREAVRRLNDWFGLRDCPQSQEMAFADQRELFPILRAAGCLRFEIGTCLGPCAGSCTRSAYSERVRAARAFLTGADLTLLDQLKVEMESASASKDFERAALLRDKWQTLSWLRRQIDRWREVREQEPFLYPVRGADNQETWYLIHGGRVVAALLAPSNGKERCVRAEEIDKTFRKRKKTAAGPVPANEVDSVLLVAAWFRKHPQEAGRRVAPKNLPAA
ncbi:MAG TPA: GIY-YIG nuclease family protein [Gemmataceae bacterium]|jgi:excinuclease ABC subunit C